MTYWAAWSGGADRIAFHAGVYLHQQEIGRVAPNQAGVSSGALIAFAIKLGMSAEDFVDFLMDVTPRKVYKHWIGWWFTGLFKGGLYNSRPLYKILTDMFEAYGGFESGALRVGYVNLNHGAYVSGTEIDSDPALRALASAAFPVLLSSPNVDGDWTSDGGVIDVTPVGAAIRAGASKIDAVITTPEHRNDVWRPSWPLRVFKLLGRSLRELDLLMEQAASDDLKICHLINQVVDSGQPAPTRYRNIDLSIVRPMMPLGMSTLKFDKDEMKRAIETGYNTAVRVYG